MIGNHKTSVINDNQVTMVCYHNTPVVKIKETSSGKCVILNNGGWYTATTKRRMNQASNQYGLKFNVFQSDFCWYVGIGNEVVEYHNGIVIDVEHNRISDEGEWD